jgi:hypothetical protein
MSAPHTLYRHAQQLLAAQRAQRDDRGSASMERTLYRMACSVYQRRSSASALGTLSRMQRTSV